jgi:hypothetical protein
MSNMIGSMAPCIGSCTVQERRDVVLFFKAIKYIDAQDGFILLWFRLRVHPRRWYTSGFHPGRWHNDGAHPPSCIHVGMRRYECMRWYQRGLMGYGGVLGIRLPIGTAAESAASVCKIKCTLLIMSCVLY